MVFEKQCLEWFGSAGTMKDLLASKLVCKPFLAVNSYYFKYNLKQYSNTVQKAILMRYYGEGRRPRNLTMSPPGGL
jgi:hypothetical protein